MVIRSEHVGLEIDEDAGVFPRDDALGPFASPDTTVASFPMQVR